MGRRRGSKTWLGLLVGEYSSSACRDRLYRMSKGRALMLLAGLFSALHDTQPLFKVVLEA